MRLDNLMYLLGSIFDVARWPVQVFQGAWRFVFTFVIPVAVMTTFPAMALLGKLDARGVLALRGRLAPAARAEPRDLAHSDPQLHQRVELSRQPPPGGRQNFGKNRPGTRHTVSGSGSAKARCPGGRRMIEGR